MYNFKRYTQTRSKLSNNTISITGSFSFGFNSGFYRREGIGNFKKVVLFFDADRKVIGFYFTNDSSAKGAFTVIHGKSGTTGSVTARSFFLNHELNKKEYQKKFPPEKVKYDDLDLFAIHLEGEDKQESGQQEVVQHSQ